MSDLPDVFALPTPEQADYSVSWPVIEGIVSPDTSDAELAELIAMATPAELEEARRRIAEAMGHAVLQRADLERRRGELVSKYPGLKSRRRPASS